MFENKAEATGTHPTHSSRLFSHNGPWVCLSVGMVWIHFDISKSVTLIILETLKSRLGDKKEIKHFSEDFAPNCMIISKITKTVCTHTHTHCRYYWPLYWENLPKDKSPTPCRAANGKCFKLFSLQRGGSALAGPGAGGLRQKDCMIRLGIW